MTGARRRRSARGARGALLVAVTLALGCGARKQVVVDFSEGPRDYLAQDYERVYERWTRHERVLTDVDVALEVWATYKSWDYREAYVERYAEIYSLPDAEKTALREAQREASRGAYEFHLTAQATNFKWNDLEKASSAWRVTLVDAIGHELPPERVKVEKLPEAYEAPFFPAKTPFTKTYSVRFPVPAGDTDFLGAKSGSLTLRIASPLGRLEPRWSNN
jgi:hypothetical protein